AGQASGTVANAQDGQIVPVTVTLVDAGLGVIRFSGERDLWVVSGNAGDLLNLSLDGVATQGFPAMGDTFVELFNPDGTFLAADDDSGPGLFSFLQVRLVQSGPHVIVARGFSSNTGGYRVSAAVNGVSVVPQEFAGGTVTGRVLGGD